MRLRILFLLVFGLLVLGGCTKTKSTNELVVDLNSPEAADRVKAVRLLPQDEGDAAKVVPALIASLQDKVGPVRWSAAIKLGYLGEQAKEAIPALQKAQQDRDPRVREAAGVALSRIDPARFPTPSRPRKK